ncbi:hypothetical protein RB620_29205 [Paenibacillus sp. LHD-117]|uniref:hypothetical protein n=1 Tax=Paenibacillus sp. LHD-117 TaxID=3071412 RepID=UPI0027DEEA90|nr:hypothetical protein [Paenibacillus sp. LHD-117]MDQ6423501.1 hypothetical protein [Paenibacillus sp. LHD-117]
MKLAFYSKRPILVASAAFVLLLAGIAALLLSKDSDENEAVSDKHLISIPNEEFSFYLDIVRSGELNREISDELKKKAMDYSKNVYAKLMLAERYQVINTYSFEKLQQAHNEENQKRKKMKKEGQVFYGPEQLELSDYFEYFLDEMTVTAIAEIAEKESASLEKDSKAYYDEIKDLFSDETFLFDLVKQSPSGAPDEIETFELNNDNRRILENTEPELLKLLETMQAGDEAPYIRNNEPHLIKLKSRTQQGLAFEENKEQAIKFYVNDVYYVKEMNRIKDAMEIEVLAPLPE